MYNIHGHEVFGIDVPPRSGGEPLLTYAIVHGALKLVTMPCSHPSHAQLFTLFSSRK